MSNNNILKKAIILVTRAIAEDKAMNYEKALRLYEYSIKYFIDAINHEAESERAKESIRIKCAEYLNRADKLYTHIRTKLFKAIDSVYNNKDDSDESCQMYADMKIRLNQLKDTIVIEKPNIQWTDVAGLDSAKKELKETVIMPTKFENLFTDTRKPCKSILLFGPQRTGKSYLAKALATEAKNSMFFSVSSSKMVSKWLNESKKLMKTLFEMARQCRPSIIFFDEIDSLCSTRSDIESESARRIKTEFLFQMQGLAQGMCKDIWVLGSTNIPWLLEPDIRKCFEKLIYIPLPDENERDRIIRINIGNTPNSFTEEEIKVLAKNIDGFSGAHISVLIREALMQPVRKVQRATHFRKVIGQSRSKPLEIFDDLLTPCSPDERAAIEMSWVDIPGNKLLEPVVTMSDILLFLANAEPTVNDTDLKMFKDFMDDFGRELYIE